MCVHRFFLFCLFVFKCHRKWTSQLCIYSCYTKRNPLRSSTLLTSLLLSPSFTINLSTYEESSYFFDNFVLSFFVSPLSFHPSPIPPSHPGLHRFSCSLLSQKCCLTWKLEEKKKRKFEWCILLWGFFLDTSWTQPGTLIIVKKKKCIIFLFYFLVLIFFWSVNSSKYMESFSASPPTIHKHQQPYESFLFFYNI